MSAPSKSPPLLEPLEPRRFLSGEPVTEEFAGITFVADPATHEFDVKAGERMLFLASSTYYTEQIILDDGHGDRRDDNNYIDYQTGLTYLAARDVTLRVTITRNIDNDDPTSASYRLFATRFPPAHADAVADDLAAATPVASPGTVNGTFDWHDDTDWYSFHAEAGVAYKLALDSEAGYFDSLTATVHAPDGTLLTQTERDPGPGDQYGRFISPTAGTYFVRIRSLAIRGDYTFSATPMPDDHSDFPGRATRLRSGEQEGVLTGRNDVDVFRFLARPGKRYELRGHGSVHLDFVGEEPGGPFTVRRPRAGGGHVYVTAAKRWQYVRVFRPRPTHCCDLADDRRYSLSLTTKADDLPDGTTRNASVRPVAGNLESAPDYDAFFFIAPAAGAFQLTNVRPRLDDGDRDDRPIHVRVRRDGDRTPILNRRLAPGERLTLDLKRGRHLIEVGSAAPGFDRVYKLTLRPLDPD